jgi:hypothetical protein
VFAEEYQKLPFAICGGIAVLSTIGGQYGADL